MVSSTLEARQARRSGEQGFTLVELLVVIVILGILAAIAVFAISGITDKGQSAANKTTCSVLETAEEAYYAQNGSYVTGANAQQTLKVAGFLKTSSPSFTITPPTGTDVGYTITYSGGTC